MATLVGNWVAQHGMAKASDEIKKGSTGRVAIENGINAVEINADIPYVGVGGAPNALGQMQFDGAIMNGRTGEVGAVAGLTITPRAVSVAGKILDFGLHALIGSDGADRFARENNIIGPEPLSESASEKYLAWREASFGNRSLDVVNLCKELPPLLGFDNQEERDTAIMIALDSAGDFTVGTSTSGWEGKYPGRIGDSPVVGAGFFAKNGVGAVACTHTGENTMRTGAALTVIRHLEYGLTLEASCKKAGDEILALKGGTLGPVVIHAMNSQGEVYVLGVRFPEHTSPPKYYLWNDGDDCLHERVAHLY
jgi:N4-(beta-N-acetylglucosaminyl)-L-asparaginase